MKALGNRWAGFTSEKHLALRLSFWVSECLFFHLESMRWCFMNTTPIPLSVGWGLDDSQWAVVEAMAGGQPLVVTHGIPTLPRIYNTDPPSSLMSSWHMTSRDICRKVWNVYTYTSLSCETQPNSKRYNALSFSVQTHHHTFQSSSSRI